MRRALILSAAALLAAVTTTVGAAQAAPGPQYDISTLAGKVAALQGTAGLQVRFSGFVEEQAQDPTATPSPSTPITPSFVLTSPLDGTSVTPPDVTVNQDTAAAPQNETAIAADPSHATILVAAANDYVSRTWSCDVNGTPCSALGDGYSGTYLSTDGGTTWCCTSTGPGDLGTLIPGVTTLAGGPYDAGGDPAVAFDSRGNVYYAGLGFDRAAPPNTVEVNKGTISGSSLSWAPPTFINATTSPAVFNDKEWIAVDSHPASPYRDRVYVTWTRFLFNPATGAYVQSPIFFASSSNGGRSFTSPKSISGNVLYGQGSRPVVGPDGSLYVFWEGSTRLASINSTYLVKSTNGGASWSKPVAVAGVADSRELADTAFRVNSFPAAAVTSTGDLVATWTTATTPGATTPDATTSDEHLAGDPKCGPLLPDSAYHGNGCYSVAVYSQSTDGGATWSVPARVFAAGTRQAEGYPVTSPDRTTLSAPHAEPVEDIYPAVAAGPYGTVYLSAYRGDVVSPWQTCAAGPPPPVGRIACDTLGSFIDNTRLDYVVTDLSAPRTVTTNPINTRHGFGGSFIGDYTDLAIGSDGVAHAFWTDTNTKQDVVWFYGAQFVPTPINQQDVVVWNGTPDWRDILA